VLATSKAVYDVDLGVEAKSTPAAGKASERASKPKDISQDQRAEK
jgi:hypothetical protein